MSNRDIAKLYNNICTREFESISQRFQPVINEVKGQGTFNLGLDPEAGEKKYTQDTAKELIDVGRNPGGREGTKSSKLQQMKDAGYGEELPNNNAGDSNFFTNDDIDKANMLDADDQIRIKNMINREYNHKVREIFKQFTGNSKGKAQQKKINVMFNLLQYAAIDAEEFVMALNAQNRGDVQLLNIDLLTDQNAQGVLPISDFINDDAGMYNITYKALYGLKALGEGGTQAGPYEAALSLLSGGVISQQGKGDISVGNSLIELKAELGRVGPEEWPKRSEMIDVVTSSYNAAKNKYAPGIPDGRFNKGGTTFPNLLELINSQFPQQAAANARREIITPIVDKLYFKKHYSSNGSMIIDSFTGGDYNQIQYALVHELFRMYQDEKRGGSGEWSRMVGLNLTGRGSPAIGLFDTPVSIANAFRDGKITGDNPSVICSGPAASREYMWQLLPIQ